jgi:peroxiredoxin
VQARPGQPPAVGDRAPDIPLFDSQGKESSLRDVLKDKTVVLVFYIGYT